MIRPEKKKWRSLIRVCAVYTDKGYFNIIVLGWDVKEEVSIPFSTIPENIRMIVKPDKHLYAKVNIGAEHKEQLSFSEWEED